MKRNQEHIFITLILGIYALSCRLDSIRVSRTAGSESSDSVNATDSTKKPAEDFDGPPGYTKADEPQPVTGTNLIANIKETCENSDCSKIRYFATLKAPGREVETLSALSLEKFTIKSVEWKIDTRSSEVHCDTSGAYQFGPICSANGTRIFEKLQPRLSMTLVSGDNVQGIYSTSYGLPADASLIWLNADSAEIASASSVSSVATIFNSGKGPFNFYSGYQSTIGVTLNGAKINRSGLSGHSYFQFDGNQSGFASQNPGTSSTLDEAHTLILAIRSSDARVNGSGEKLSVFRQLIPCGGNAFSFRVDGNYRVLKWSAGDQSIALSTPPTEWTIVSASYQDSSAIQIYKNGTSVERKAINFRLDSASIPFWLGFEDNSLCSAGTANSYAQFDLAELFLFDRVLSEADRKKTECYLGRKYGIATSSCN